MSKRMGEKFVFDHMLDLRLWVFLMHDQKDWHESFGVTRGGG